MDDGSHISWLFTVAVLVLCAMFFAIAETAFSSVSRTRIKTLSDKGQPDAKNAEYVLNHFDQAITTLLICTNIVHIAAASVVTLNVTKIWGVSAVSISTITTTLVVFFFGEMLPKSIARKYSEYFSLSFSGIMKLLMIILTPAALVLTAIGNLAAKFTKGDSQVSVTEDELYDIIEDMTEEGSLDESRGDLIASALQFQDTTVESILTSRIDLIALDVNEPQEVILERVKNCNHSRLPVYEGTIDRIIGILQIRKYIKAYLAGEDTDVRKLVDKPYFIHQSTKIDDLLAIMSKERTNAAIVTDNYGGTLGIVTVEDILEELVGEIWDEDDRREENFVRISDNTYSVKSNLEVLDVMDELNIHYDEETEDELNNKIMSELTFEHFTLIPREGDRFRAYGMEISVQMMKQNRIIRLVVKKLPGEVSE